MIPPSIGSALVRAERRLVDALSLRSRAMQPRFAQVTGLWKDAPVTITTRVYEGDAVGYMRVASIGSAALQIGSLLVCARPNRALPMLTAELLSRGTVRESTLAVDLVPMTEGAGRDADCRAYAQQLPAPGDLPRDARGEAQADEWSSPNELRTRVGEGRLAEALGAFERYVDAWITLSGAAMPVPDTADAVRRRQHAYIEAQRADARTRSLLAAMFGRAWADEYVAQVLYPPA